VRRVECRKGCVLLRNAAVGLGYLVLAVALAGGVARSGAQYFYCEAFGLLPFDPCAQASASNGSTDSEETLRTPAPDCCEIVTLPTVPEGARVATASVPPPPLVALLPPSLAFGSGGTRTVVSRQAPFERWGPPQRPPNEVRTQLMVFLT
jgi:hypothetical protein